MATSRSPRSIEAVPVPSVGKRAYLWDFILKDFGAMAMPTGARSYIVRYWIGGREAPARRYTIGRHGSPWTAEKPRERATDLLELVRKKIDPVEADRAQLVAAVETKKVTERFAFPTYADPLVARHAVKRNLRSADDIRAVLRRDSSRGLPTRP